jgi:hypothetical protein
MTARYTSEPGRFDTVCARLPWTAWRKAILPE